MGAGADLVDGVEGMAEDAVLDVFSMCRVLLCMGRDGSVPTESAILAGGGRPREPGTVEVGLDG